MMVIYTFIYAILGLSLWALILYVWDRLTRH